VSLSFFKNNNFPNFYYVAFLNGNSRKNVIAKLLKMSNGDMENLNIPFAIYKAVQSMYRTIQK
jgi:hypothetical protein